MSHSDSNNDSENNKSSVSEGKMSSPSDAPYRDATLARDVTTTTTAAIGRTLSVAREAAKGGWGDAPSLFQACFHFRLLL